MVQNQSNSFYVAFLLIFNINKNIVQVYDNEDIKFFCQNLIDIALGSNWYVGQVKRYHLVLKIAIAGLEGRFLFITFSESHLIVNIDEIKPSETLIINLIIF